MGKIIFSIIAFVAAGAIFFLYTKPTYATIDVLQSQSAQYKEALDKAAQLQALKQKLLTQYNSFNINDVTRLQTMLPDHVDNIGLILDIDSLASHYGMALENIDVAASGNSSAQGSEIGALNATGQKYDSISLHFGTYGTYNNFRSFLTDLEQSLRVVDLQTLSVSQQNTPTGAQAYRYDMTIKTYWLK